MCGVIGLIYQHHRNDLGRIAAELLETLEYRGYDSTGAAVQGEGLSIELRKGVGAPSVMVHELGITELSGQILCGQVRWATFGAVDRENAQPHLMRCKVLLYGAHNGNVTNSDRLKEWLLSEGHAVLSDNDGEMVVHTIEHCFAQALLQLKGTEEGDAEARRAAMRRAIAVAVRKLEGSFAAVVVDPKSRTCWAIKQGSSLYVGQGSDPVGGAFTIASSDLSAVLKLTRILLPLSEGEMVEFHAEGREVYGLAPEDDGQIVKLERAPVRSRLRAKDTALVPPFETFMDQEISAQEQTCRDVITLFQGGSKALAKLLPVLAAGTPGSLEAVLEGLERLRGQCDDEELRRVFFELVDLAPFQGLLSEIPVAIRERLREVAGERLSSAESGFLTDLLPMARDAEDRLAVRVMDALLEREEVFEFGRVVTEFIRLCQDSSSRGGRLFVVCCGSSYHAAKAAALFFNEIARTELIPMLPGEFRGQYSRTLKDGDLFVAVSQSGETKDLIDVLNDVKASGRAIRRVGLINNLNSTLAQEKSDLCIPLRCGAEIAVPATKSFTNQMAVFYCLALRLARARLRALPEEERDQMERSLCEREAKLSRLPDLLRETFDTTDAELEQAAELLYLCPSIQILATRITAVAKEGALKIREVVLNHTEGFEGSEFKHGPNTILGFNTIFGPRELDRLVRRIGQTLDALIPRALGAGLDADAVARLAQAVTDAAFSPRSALISLHDEERALLHQVLDRGELLRALEKDYPLIYVTGPDARDVDLTISQINTHKIRGASTVVIAEEHQGLRATASKPPADNPDYRSVYITLPRTNDSLLTVFSATVVLQRLALKMSLLKMHYLDRLGVQDHGVHPDVPKNVSKSITVD